MKGPLFIVLCFSAASFIVSANIVVGLGSPEELLQGVGYKELPQDGNGALCGSHSFLENPTKHKRSCEDFSKRLKDVKLTATCRDKMTVYFDGQKQTSAPLRELNNWHKVTTFTVPYGVREIGIECDGYPSSYGIVAWLSTGRMTDQTWRCSNESFQTGMSPAKVLGPVNVRWHQQFFGKPIRARWIWTAPWKGRFNADTKVFCKGSVKVPPTNIETCPDGFTYNARAEFCFKVVKAPFPVTWPQAAHMCQQLGLDVELASPDTDERMELLKNTLKEERHLIGLIKIEQSWSWTVTGKRVPIDSPWWYPGQPNNHHGQHHGEFYIKGRDSKGRRKMGLNDTQCLDRISNFICEKRLRF